MKAYTLRILCFCLCFVAMQGIRAQGPPGGGAPRSGMPGGPGFGEPRPDRPAPGDSRQPSPLQSRNALQFGPVGRWWDDKSVVTGLGLSRQQQKQMDKIFDANRPAIVSSYKAFLKAQDRLQNVNRGAHPDQAKIFAAIDAVNQARGDLQKATSAMLLQIRAQMSPDQIDKLEKLD